MILDRNGTDNKRPNTNINGNKTFYSFSVTPGRTNYIFKKAKLNEDMQINCLPQFKTSRQNDSSPVYNRNRNKDYMNLTIQDNNQVSCTSFMKNYVEKLKKQRKRQNKKLQNAKNQKQQAQKNNIFNKTDITKNDFYLAKQMNHIFILEKVPKIGGNNIMNTISIVEENMDQLHYKKDHANKRKQKSADKNILDWDEPSWANKQKIDKLIKQIRNSRNKISDVEHIPAASEQFQKNGLNNLNLPSLRSTQIKIRVPCKKKAKKLNQPAEINFKSLQPWKQDPNTNQFTIEEYNVYSSREI